METSNISLELANISCYYNYTSIFLRDEFHNHSPIEYSCPGEKICCEIMNCCTPGIPIGLSVLLYFLLACVLAMACSGLKKWFHTPGGRSCQHCLARICCRV